MIDGEKNVSRPVNARWGTVSGPRRLRRPNASIPVRGNARRPWGPLAMTEGVDRIREAVGGPE
jgi:hypothetical protein